MADLFARTLAAAFQAFAPVALLIAWLRCARLRAHARAAWLGVAAAVPLSVLAASRFQTSVYQARWEAIVALAAIALAVVAVSQLRLAAKVGPANPYVGSGFSRATLAVAAALVIVRETMVIGSLLETTIAMRASVATAVVLEAVAIAIAASAAWIALSAVLPNRAASTASRIGAALFAAQLVFYAIHKSAEARFLPGADFIDAATEPYGPDSRLALYVSILLIGLPVAYAVAASMGEWRTSRARMCPAMSMRGAALAAVALVAIAGLVVAATTVRRVLGARIANAAVSSAPEIASIAASPHMVFVTRAAGAAAMRVGVAPIASEDGKRATSGLECMRVGFASGRGICLQSARRASDMPRAVLFDAALRPWATFELAGIPSRTRVSPDGRLGAITVFVTGAAHNYVSSGFSTKTILLDMATGGVIGELEQFTTWRDGKRFSAPDFNFWGVTFAHDGRTFYASLRTTGDVEVAPGRMERRAQTYLVHGDVPSRTLTVVHDNAECPSIAPSDRVVAYKKRVAAGPAPWRFYVLDLPSMRERAIDGEPRSIDDQIEWLDDAHVLYAASRPSNPAMFDVYSAAIDGGDPPRVFLSAAESPIVVR